MPAGPETIIFGVVADTHIPDRARKLPKGLLEKFQEAQVQRILHAGDASGCQVLRALKRVAPVSIVQGNRDWLLGLRIPKHISFTANGVRITLAHGHRSILHYLIDKWAYIRKGYRFKRYYDQLSHDYPDADVIVFGHTHHQTAKWVEGRLLFNPGAAYPCRYNHFTPQFGIISITPEGEIRTEFHHLNDQNSQSKTWGNIVPETEWRGKQSPE